MFTKINYQNFTISNYLILISIILTFFAYIKPEFYFLWMNTFYLENWNYFFYFIQYFTYSLLHWWILHLFFNSVFIFYFWNIVEAIIGKNKYIIFFLFVTFFNWIWLSIFSDWNTVWISWFAMALLAYYTLELKERKDDEYKWWITAIIINIWIWINPQISLLWHLFWAIAWVIFYLINRKRLNKLMTPIKNIEEL